ncbi:hypothetical protein [Streptomyces sp. NPDC056468]|uniref:hypothetical protein n=1 Tax=Streptomyces sp. NPDC056468 TaxID=3345830 RepID=UPI0036C2447E
MTGDLSTRTWAGEYAARWTGTTRAGELGRVILNDVQLSGAHPTWWRAPSVATLLALPLLVWEYGMFRADGYTSGIEVMILWGFALLAIAWALPHRRSLRTLRMAAAGAGLGCALLPVLFAVLMAMAMASG